MPYFDDQFRERGGPDAELPPSESHRRHLGVLRDSAFVSFSDSSGLLDTHRMPTYIELRDQTHPTWLHRFSVRVNTATELPQAGNISVGTFSIMFVHTISDEQDGSTGSDRSED